MKNRKLFAILTLVAFMLTMMPVMAFAAVTSSDVEVYVDSDYNSAKANGETTIEVEVEIDGELGTNQKVVVWATRNGAISDLELYASAKNDENGDATPADFQVVTETKTLYVASNDAGTVTFKAVLVDSDLEDDNDLFDAIIKSDVRTYNVMGNDKTATFKATSTGTKKFVVTSSPEVDTVLPANNGVDYFEITAKLVDANNNKVTGKEVSIEIDKLGATLSKETATTNSQGKVTFKVSATKPGKYVVTLSADGTTDKEITLVFDNSGINKLVVAKQPTGVIATTADDYVNVPLTATDANGNVLKFDVTGKGTPRPVNSYFADEDEFPYAIQFTKVPADSDIDTDDVYDYNDGVVAAGDIGAWFFVTKYDTLVARFRVDEPGDYVAKIYNTTTGAYDYVNFTAGEFDEAVSAEIVYDAVTYNLNASVEEPSVNVYDANGVKRTAKSTKFSYTGVGVVDFSSTKGSFTITNDDKYLGKEIVVNVVADKCFATTTLKIADVPAYLVFAETTVPVGTEATVNMTSVDLNGEKAAIGKGYYDIDSSYVVTAKPEGAVVSVDADSFNADDFKTYGTGSIKVASNKEGTVKVNVVLAIAKNRVAQQANENDPDNDQEYIYLTGTAVVNFGNASTVEGASKAATLIIGSNIFVADGVVKTSEVAPVIINGRTYLPIRALGEALGATVNYADGVVTIVYGETTATMTIGSQVMTVGTETVQMDAAPYVEAGRTMVPVRYAGQALGYQFQVTANADGSTASVTLFK